jgi:hypothetical protein
VAELSAVIADLRQDRDSWREQAPTVGLARSETGAATRETPDVVAMAADRGVKVRWNPEKFVRWKSKKNSEENS